MRFLIAFGPTREPLDPVRFLSNYSTGMMGCALVEAAKARGHKVDAVECPVPIQTARELQSELKERLPKCDAFIMAAAVCDARPASVFHDKIKKKSLSSIRLVRNPDILASLAGKKRPNQVFIGFALESRDIFRNALDKLKRKGLDLIVLQKVGRERSPFGEKAIEVYVIDKMGRKRHFKSVTKKRLALFLVRETERFVKLKSFGAMAE